MLPTTQTYSRILVADNQETEVLTAGCGKHPSKQGFRIAGIRNTGHLLLPLLNVASVLPYHTIRTHPTRTNMVGIWTKCSWFLSLRLRFIEGLMRSKGK